MRRRRSYWQEDIPEFEEIAAFGGATIVRDLRGRYNIRGRTDNERKQAHDWHGRSGTDFMWPPNKPKPTRWPSITP